MRPLPLALLLVLSACPKKLPDLSRFTPQVRVDRLEPGAVSWEAVEADLVLDIENPNPVGLSLERWAWDLDVDGRDLLAGEDADGMELEPRGRSELAIPVRLAFADLLEAARAGKGEAPRESLPFTASGVLGFGTPLGIVDVPFEHDGTLPVLRRPDVRVEGVRVEKLDALRGRAELAVDIQVAHRGGAALDLGALGWDLSLGGYDVADGSLDQVGRLADGETRTVSLPVGFNLLELGALVARNLQQRKPVPVGFRGRVDVNTPLGALPLQIDVSDEAPVQ
jgi:hypothetical protein